MCVYVCESVLCTHAQVYPSVTVGCTEECFSLSTMKGGMGRKKREEVEVQGLGNSSLTLAAQHHSHRQTPPNWLLVHIFT